MTLSLTMIIINVLADLTLIGGLAYLMSRATRLNPHVALIDAPAAEPIRARAARPVRHVRRSGYALAPVAS
jgi:hypothetical protein